KLHHIDSPLPAPPVATATFEHVAAYQAMLAEQDEVALLMQLNECKTEEGRLVSSHVLKMNSYIDKMECLRHPLTHVLAVNTILGYFPKPSGNCVMNYNMQGWDDKSLGELHSMLKTVEKNVSSKSVVSSLHMIRE
ncbi:hypothetical protein Tco_0369590, partial [Tanacetum coccineum]